MGRSQARTQLFLSHSLGSLSSTWAELRLLSGEPKLAGGHLQGRSSWPHPQSILPTPVFPHPSWAGNSLDMEVCVPHLAWPYWGLPGPGQGSVYTVSDTEVASGH